MRFTVQRKLVVAFALLLLITAVGGLVGIVGMSRISQMDTRLYEHNLLGVRLAERANAQIAVAGRDIRQALIFDDAKVRTDKIASASEALAVAETELTKLDAMADDPTSKARIAVASKAVGGYKELFAKVVPQIRAGDTAGAKVTMTDGAKAAADINSALDALIAAENKDAASATAANVATYESMRNVLIGVVVVSILIGLVTATWLSSSIVRNVRLVADATRRLSTQDLPALARGVEAVAAGDLTRSVRIQYQRLAVNSSDEIGDMAAEFNRMGEQLEGTSDAFERMVASLRGLIGKVSANADDLNVASAQLSSASDQTGSATQQIAATIQQVARGNQEQARAVQEITGAMTTLRRDIAGIARGAGDQVRQVGTSSTLVGQTAQAIDVLSRSADEVAASGGRSQSLAATGADVVGRAVQSMQAIRTTVTDSAGKVSELGRRSEQIGQIVEAIDEIAEQTNLLALNAAIEAARAGEHGRGFAVVADEVRKLAERSSRSTKEISQLIAAVQRETAAAVAAMQAGVREVESGVGLANEAGRALDEIEAGARSANVQLQQMSAMIAGISRSTNGIVGAIERVSSVAEANTASTTQMVASAERIAGELESVSAVSEENSASVEEVSAGTEEMSAQMQEIVASARTLAEMADGLRQAIAAFRLEA